MNQKVKVRLLRPHRHGEFLLSPGSVIEVKPRQAEFLLGRGIAEKAGVWIPPGALWTPSKPWRKKKAG